MTIGTVKLPSVGAMARHALPSVLEGAVGPAAVFYGILMLIGVRGALIGALAWSYAAVARRLMLGREVSGLLMLGSALLTVRTVIGLATDSGFIYFLQPSVGTFLVAVAFLISVALKRPLAERLARDFCPLDPELMSRTFVRRFFLRISLLWTMILLLNAALSLWLLLSSSLAEFVLLRNAVSWGAMIGGIALSTWWFTRTLRGQSLRVQWRGTV